MKEEQEKADEIRASISKYVDIVEDLAHRLDLAFHDEPMTMQDRRNILANPKNNPDRYRVSLYYPGTFREAMFLVFVQVVLWELSDEELDSEKVRKVAAELLKIIIENPGEYPWFSDRSDDGPKSFVNIFDAFVEKGEEFVYKNLKKMFKNDPKLKEMLLGGGPEQSGDEAGGAGEDGDSPTGA